MKEKKNKQTKCEPPPSKRSLNRAIKFANS